MVLLRKIRQFGPAAFMRGVFARVPSHDEIVACDDVPRYNSNNQIFLHGAHFSVRPNSTDHAIVGETWDVYMTMLREHGLVKFRDVLDFGAHIGGFSIQLALNADVRGQLKAIEPEPDNFAILVENIARNQLGKRVEPIAAAVSDRFGVGKFALSTTSNTGGHHLTSGLLRRDYIEVSTIDVARLVAQCGPRTLMKIDIEGMEFAIFRRLRGQMQQVSVIVGELHTNRFALPRDCVAILENEGFKVTVRGRADIPSFIATREDIWCRG
jgi:FkbM family methyltransferase